MTAPPSPHSPHSLQGRLTLLVLGLVAAVWVVTAVVMWRDVQHELDELLDSHLAQAAALLVVQQAGDAHEDDDHHVDAPLLHRYATRTAFQVWHQGTLVQRSANAPTTPMLSDSKHFKTGFRSVTMGGEDWRVFAAEGPEHDVRVFVGEQLASRRSILWAVLRSTLWPLALALPLLALAAWWAVRQGTAPLRRLGTQLAQRGPRALEPVRMDGAPSEMAPMLDALNGLFDRIGTLMESERRFTADAAHELRTPIAAIRTQAQVALGESDATLRRHALQSTLAGCDRATRLVEQLLTLSRLEANGARPAAPVDLAAVVRRLVGELAAPAIDKAQTIGFDVAPNDDARCPVAADETLLGVLARNLIDNAIRYSPAGATVQVAVVREARRARLVVEDGGPGLSDADLARLGERFFRVLGSGESGSGLGWSIVRRIAAAQGAEVTVQRSAALGGLRVEVAWPLLESAA
ncbi:ATP-binding protein [Ideonella sp. A 288]|uniref:ATP-binding protein n=1 Tax=Ideonella sp. A 288 TaxID=1962181 RepID=UPI001F1D0255|nr:ATP-binding protein [Ideonella sp. A 288]